MAMSLLVSVFLFVLMTSDCKATDGSSDTSISTTSSSSSSNIGLILLSFILIILSIPITTLIFSTGGSNTITDNTISIGNINKNTFVTVDKIATTTTRTVDQESYMNNNNTNNNNNNNNEWRNNEQETIIRNTNVQNASSRTEMKSSASSNMDILPPIPGNTNGVTSMKTTTMNRYTDTDALTTNDYNDMLSKLSKATTADAMILSSIILGQRNVCTPTDTRLNTTDDTEDDIFSMKCNCSNLFFANTIFGSAESIFRMGTGDCYHK